MEPASFPVQKLLFYVAQEFPEDLVPEVERFVASLSSSRAWSVAVPVFVNESFDGIETLGGYLSVYNALPPDELPVHLDKVNLDEVKDFIGKLAISSKEKGVAFELELDQVPVGSIDNGATDKNLDVGLIGEWERVLIEREALTKG